MLHLYYRLIWSFDALVAQRKIDGAVDAVIGYENSALRLFQAAKKAGKVCILDNSGVHHAVQDRQLGYVESDAFHRRIVARKEAELALADVIFTCSTFAADSFRANGVPDAKLRIVPLGCDTARFTPADRQTQDTPDRIRFLFVGGITSVKGADVLAAAAAQLRREAVPFELALVGATDQADAATLGAFRSNATLLGKVAHDRLPPLYQKYDCLVAPSRFDSFSFVVAEAMASGLPVIVSEHVGAKDLVVHDHNGWVVPSGEPDALNRRMQWCAHNVGKVRAMRQAALDTATQWGWPRYHANVLEAVSRCLEDFGPRAAYRLSKTGIGGSSASSQSIRVDDHAV